MVSSQVSALGQTVLPMVAQSPAQQLVQIFQQQQQSALASGANTIATFSAGRTTQIISNPGNHLLHINSMFSIYRIMDREARFIFVAETPFFHSF